MKPDAAKDIRKRSMKQLRIKEIRLRQGLSQQELAKKIKIIDQPTLSRYEAGDYEIRFSTLCVIAKALNVHVTDLFDTNDTPSLEEVHTEGPAHAFRD